MAYSPVVRFRKSGLDSKSYTALAKEIEKIVEVK
jgi:hypothetical protein